VAQLMYSFKDYTIDGLWLDLHTTNATVFT